jgi:hypothetical protein
VHEVAAERDAETGRAKAELLDLRSWFEIASMFMNRKFIDHYTAKYAITLQAVVEMWKEKAAESGRYNYGYPDPSGRWARKD